ncbi:MAG: glycosyltransferase family 4 protein, partial [Crenarchaeota archaeon]|nr:glycosyltransferase family 4 protein [Thermoproteota archaeon]
IHNVFILDEIFDSIKDIDKIIQSCSLGIAWYNDISIGFRTAGESSGKIPAYFRFGLPVVAKKYTSTYNAIEKTGCGLCVENYDDIINSLKMIENRFDYYSCNAIKEYEKKYRFEKYREKLLIFFNTNL